MAAGRDKGTFYYIPSAVRNNLIIVIGEFCGTFMFLLLAYLGASTAIITNSPDPESPRPNNPSTVFYIAAAFGISLGVNVWIFFRVSGGIGILVLPAQLAASIGAAALTLVLLPGGKLVIGSALSPQTSIIQGLFLEMLLTSQLVLTVYFLAVEKSRATFLAPVGIGLSVFIAHLAGANFSGSSLNPARSFGPAVFAGFEPYSWIYWLGPFMGALLAYGVYSLLKWMDYKTANPGQDDDDIERGTQMQMQPLMTGTRPAYSSDGVIKISSEGVHDVKGPARAFNVHPPGAGSPYLNVRFSWNKDQGSFV
ncbi:hypothetical protein GQ602_000521 [Ophiocordyceps camponoti-floridani]|uniref:Aquaporin n=1 Tax=Ophiocordyceps camponoti-floridani TaxID=2030778 RepID=A0A8H4QCK6_9HYPO|nr:hypothetical protein GQ602_000521 [Ophiocordyceps camponoti-floridani]